MCTFKEEKDLEQIVCRFNILVPEKITGNSLIQIRLRLSGLSGFATFLKMWLSSSTFLSSLVFWESPDRIGTKERAKYPSRGFVKSPQLCHAGTAHGSITDLATGKLSSKSTCILALTY